MRAQDARRRGSMVTALVSLAACTVALAGVGGWRALGSTGPPGIRRPGGTGRHAAESRQPAPGRHTASAAGAVPLSRHPAGGTIGPNARLAAALAPVLRRLQGVLAVGVFDPASGLTAFYHPHRRFDTASIVKADILAVLLIQHRQAGTPLSEGQRELATQMIEDSDNDAATALWDAVGGTMGMEAGNAALGLHGIRPGASGYWGLTTTTVSGELGLLSDLTSGRSPLPAAARRYELDLMRDVEPAQAWGITAAATPRTRPAVKNGWLPVGPDGQWVINSIGVIRHAGQRMNIVVLSSGQPSEAAGIGQVQAAARAVAAATSIPSGG
jgi:Beta-lactamase enzyme family